jgi:nitrous oxide reductase
MTITELQTYLIPLILVILTGVLFLKPALLTVLAQTGNETNDQFGSFNDVNQSINRNFFEFNTAIPAFNVSLFPPDQFSLRTIEVNQNDNITVNFYNMEAPTGDRHIFTIDDPYSVDLELAPGRNGTVTFIADNPGIYQFYCEYHEPTMTGQLVVLPK